MRKNILNSAILGLALLSLFSCRPKKEIVKAPQAAQDVAIADKKSENLTMLRSKDLAFNTLSLKGKAQLSVDGQENGVTLNVRIKKDEKIWFNITALGGALEVARGLITPDSLLLMNRQQRSVLRKPFAYIYDYTNKQVNFGWLQSILTGNTMNEFMVEKSSLKVENGVWILNGTEQSLAYSVLFNTLLKPSELNLNDAAEAQALKVNYDKYTPLNNGLFPLDLKIKSAVSNKEINIAVEFIKTDVNVPVEFPFTIPKGFDIIR